MSNVPNAEQCKAEAAKLVNLAWSRETDERAVLLAEAQVWATLATIPDEIVEVREAEPPPLTMFGSVPLSAFTDGQLESIVRAVHIEQTARGQLHGISTRELVEKVRDAADNGLLTLNDVRRLQAMTTDWCRAQGFAVNPST